MLLCVIGLSLTVPGLIGMFRPIIGRSWPIAETIDAKNHLRALNGMMAAVGVIALYACIDLVRFRFLVIP
jgi:hypothetical protein